MSGYRRPNGAFEWWLEFVLIVLVALGAFLLGAWLA